MRKEGGKGYGVGFERRHQSYICKLRNNLLPISHLRIDTKEGGEMMFTQTTYGSSLTYWQMDGNPNF